MSSLPPASEPQQLKIDSRAGLEAAVDQVLPLARRQIMVFANTLGSEWNQDARAGTLREFCLASRRNELKLVLHDVQPLYRNCPRLLNLLRQFGHVLAIHETHLEAKHIYDPFIIVDD
ncbi:MAG: hypothetical protein KIT73_20235, partial [Burkholderiales bacterium]|nr:hypothetical protein [Burkholderiales bacterium]